MHTSTKVTLIGLGLALAGAATTQAQSASISVTANVFQPITVTGFRALDFGNVFPGVPKSIPLASASAGRFDVAGQVSAPVSLTFGLPPALANGVNSLTIGSWSGDWSGTTSSTGANTFTPSGSATSATLSAGGLVYVFVSATVTPGAAQVAGSYLGTVTMTVAY